MNRTLTSNPDGQSRSPTISRFSLPIELSTDPNPSGPLMVDRCFGTKPLGKGAVIGVTRKKWQQFGLPHVVDIEHHPNVLVFTMTCEEQAIFAWNNQPYNISGSLMAVKHWDGKGQTHQVCFKNIVLTTHMIDVPWRLRKEKFIKEFATNYFPGYIAIDESTINPMKWCREVKLAVNVTMADPLQPGFILGGSEGRVDQKIIFQYERLQEVCIYCGRIGHEIRNCDERAEHIKEGYNGVPTGEYDNLKACSSMGQRVSWDSEDLMRGTVSKDRWNRWQDRSDSSGGSFSTPSLHSPMTVAITPSPGGSSARSNSHQGKEPLRAGTIYLSPKFHHFFPDAPDEQQKSSSIRPINLHQLFEGSQGTEPLGYETEGRASSNSMESELRTKRPTPFDYQAASSQILIEPISPTPLFPPGYGPRMTAVRVVGGPNPGQGESSRHRALHTDPAKHPSSPLVDEVQGDKQPEKANFDGPAQREPNLGINQTGLPPPTITKAQPPTTDHPPTRFPTFPHPPNFSLGPFPSTFQTDEQSLTLHPVSLEASLSPQAQTENLGGATASKPEPSSKAFQAMRR
ncbi:hypothetical protein LINGRAHAP2_LOCUS31868 [Linum grandiflorum]